MRTKTSKWRRSGSCRTSSRAPKNAWIPTRKNERLRGLKLPTTLTNTLMHLLLSCRLTPFVRTSFSVLSSVLFLFGHIFTLPFCSPLWTSDGWLKFETLHYLKHGGNAHQILFVPRCDGEHEYCTCTCKHLFLMINVCTCIIYMLHNFFFWLYNIILKMHSHYYSHYYITKLRCLAGCLWTIPSTVQYVLFAAYYCLKTACEAEHIMQWDSAWGIQLFFLETIAFLNPILCKNVLTFVHKCIALWDSVPSAVFLL